MNRTEIFIHPVRGRILQYLSLHKEAAAGELIAYMPDVSKASVYNHIKILEQHHIIKVLREKRIRGTVEKFYGVEENLEEGVEGNITVFLLQLLMDFQKYYEEKSQKEVLGQPSDQAFGEASDQTPDQIPHQGDVDGKKAKDRPLLFARRDFLCVTDEDYREFMEEYGALCKKYMGHCGKTQGGKLRCLSLISSPVSEVEKE